MYKNYTHKVVDIVFLTNQTFKLIVEKNNLSFIPGQCMNVGPAGLGVTREYSSYGDCNSNFLEFLIRRLPKGLVSNSLAELNSGDLVEVHGSYGDFTLKEKNRNKSHLFIGSGTGIAPFRSFALSKKNFPGFVLFASIPPTTAAK